MWSAAYCHMHIDIGLLKVLTLVGCVQSLENPMNKKMILLSESDVPLYSPHVTYLQLMMETRSRLNACKNEGVRGQSVCLASIHSSG